MTIPTFVDVRLPDYIEKGAVGGPGFNTTITETSSGDEKRNINWEQAKGKYDISYGVKQPSDLEAILAFFYARRGRAVGFRFRDWLDFFANEQSLGIGDGTKTVFQLVKLYGDYTRIIKKPVAGTVKLFFNGTEQVSGWSVDTSTGIVTFDTAVTSGVAVTGTFKFDVPVRFDLDDLGLSLEFLSPDEETSYGSVPSINLVEVRK